MCHKRLKERVIHNLSTGYSQTVVDKFLCEKSGDFGCLVKYFLEGCLLVDLFCAAACYALDRQRRKRVRCHVHYVSGGFGHEQQYF